MRLIRTSSLIETAERHVSSIPDTNLDKTEIASYLGRVAAVTFYAEMEQQVQVVVKGRLSGFKDEKLMKFVISTNDGMLKRMKRKEISETVALFGESCKEIFVGKIPDDEFIRFNNVITDRHHISHGAGAPVTLDEVRIAVEIGEKILTAVEESIV